MSEYQLNWKPSPIDERDWKFSQLLAAAPEITPPEQADVSVIIPEVYDQGRIGSCTGNAGAMLGLFQSRLQKREIAPSRLMLYYGAREEIGETESDSGAYIRDIFKSWAKNGVAPESLWRYDESKVTVRPSDEAYKEGKKTLATAYRALDNVRINELKSCIAMGHPFEFGFLVPSSFMYGAWASTMPMPKSGETILGGHAVTAVGYDDKTRLFKIKNSWGANWKAAGYFYMPYDFITNRDWCSDFWMLEGITHAMPPDPTPTNVTSIIDLKKIFKNRKDLKPLREKILVEIGKEMGLNTDLTKPHTENLAIVAGWLGL